MCGIAGFIGAGELSDLQKMVTVLTHRGPDDQGLWHNTDAGAYLGHRRLSVIDLSDGHQPMWTSDSQLGVVFNGEIYNHLSLRKELETAGHVFLTDHSDTEVLLHGYREWGHRLPEKLNGMWAFAIYDTAEDRIFLSRDRFGQKPLFYTLQNNTFAFASELTALVSHPSVSSSLSTMGLQKYYAYAYIPAPNTVYEQIYKLPGGHNLVFNARTREFAITEYWRFALEPDENISQMPEEELGQQIVNLLRQAIDRRMMADVPLGILLSGGIDSSAIATLACKHRAEGSVSSFSIGFNERTFDESEHAKRAASHAGTLHHEAVLDLPAIHEILPEICEKLDEPLGDSSLPPTSLLCRETRKKVTVALGGDGADELFAGYDPFLGLRHAENYSALIPRPIHKAVRWLASLLPTSHGNMTLGFRVRRMLQGLSYPAKYWNPSWLAPVEISEFNELFGAKPDIEEIYSEAIKCWDQCQSASIVDKTLAFYTRVYLQDDILVKVDRASMMSSLEVRSPFLDIDLVNFIRRIPHSWKLRNGTTKYILKKALEKTLPSGILHRKKKGFGSPVGAWLQNGKLTLSAEEIPAPLSSGFIMNKLAEHRNLKMDHRLCLWNTWVLSNMSL